MYQLLPQEYIEKLHKQYRVRLATVFLWFLAITIVIGAISLFPSYLLLNTQTKEVESRLAEQVKVTSLDNSKEIDAKLTQTTEILKNFDMSAKKFQPSLFVQLVVKYRLPGLSLTSFEVLKIPGGGASIGIVGEALNREILSTFKKNIQKDSQVTAVVLPDSDLAKSRDIKFSMKIITK